MNDRERAMFILKQARDLLADRMTQRVLEGEEQILDDARGDSYLGDIDAIYESFGMKLSHLNSLINNLPAESAATHTTSYSTGENVASFTAAEATHAEQVFALHPSAITGPYIITPPALPSPKEEQVHSFDLAVTFQSFAQQILGGNLVTAGKMLAILLELEESRAHQCACVFHQRWLEDASFSHKAAKLRQELLEENYNPALLLLAECFGLVGLEAIRVAQTLRSRLQR